MDLTEEYNVWELYSRYVKLYMSKVKDDISTLMTPGLFCEYFAIHLDRALKSNKPYNMNTFMNIVTQLADPQAKYCSHPCMYPHVMNIYTDEEGNTNSLCDWKL